MVDLIQHPHVVWTPVHTRPRCEKVVGQFCERFGLTYYLPLRRQVKRYQRRNVEHFLPMFGGYIFVQLEQQTRMRLMESHRVVNFLDSSGARELQLLDDLREVQRLELASMDAELVVQPELVPGTPVLIAAGPLAGLTGIVQRRQAKTRVSVNVDMLGQSVSVDLDVGEVAIETV